MATSGDAVASVLGSALGGAAAPVSGMVSVIGSLVSKALDFIPDPQKKLELQQHALDLQAAAQQQQLVAETKEVQASAAAQADAHLAKVRAVFCYSICAAVVFNLVIAPLLHATWMPGIQPIMLPTNLLAIFAVIMLGLVGVPQGMAAVRDIMAMPGESQVSVLGIKAGNKS